VEVLEMKQISKIKIAVRVWLQGKEWKDAWWYATQIVEGWK